MTRINGRGTRIKSAKTPRINRKEKELTQGRGKPYTAYTDGSCSGNPGPGGWAFLLVTPSGRIEAFSGGKYNTHGHSMEYEAIRQALKAMARGSEWTLVSDSHPIVQILNKVASGEPYTACRRDMLIVEEIRDLIEERDVKFVWKRRDSSKYNQICDMMAKQETYARKLAMEIGAKLPGNQIIKREWITLNEF
jgi:ribonuclease HI